MNPIVVFVLCCLACWRVCHFVANEDGPFFWMWDLRYFYLDSEVGKLLACVKCMSVWLSALFCAALFWKSFLLYWLAMSAVVMFIEEAYGVLWSRRFRADIRPKADQFFVGEMGEIRPEPYSGDSDAYGL